jgi:pyridoxamine 5'-phosphate oxidase
MNKSDVFTFLNGNPTFSLATLENKKPHVRVITLFRADDNGIIFATGKHKDVYKQLIANPYVELLFWIADEGTQIRVSGAAKLFEDLEIKKLVVEKFTFLKPWVEQEGYDQLAPFCLENAKAFVWTQEAEFNPKEYIIL